MSKRTSTVISPQLLNQLGEPSSESSNSRQKVANMVKKPQTKPKPKPKKNNKRKASAVASGDSADNLDQIYEIEQIVDSRKTKKGTEYLVKWLGYASVHNTWEPASNFVSTIPIETFETMQAKKRKGSSSARSSQAHQNTALNRLLEFERVDLQSRLLRRSVVENLLLDFQEGNKKAQKALFDNALGLFVRLKVDATYQVAQIIELQKADQGQYDSNDVSTNVLFMVALEDENTLAKLSYISDGTEISTTEFDEWKLKLEGCKLKIPNNARIGTPENLEKLVSLAHVRDDE